MSRGSSRCPPRVHDGTSRLRERPRLDVARPRRRDGRRPSEGPRICTIGSRRMIASAAARVTPSSSRSAFASSSSGSGSVTQRPRVPRARLRRQAPNPPFLKKFNRSSPRQNEIHGHLQKAQLGASSRPPPMSPRPRARRASAAITTIASFSESAETISLALRNVAALELRAWFLELTNPSSSLRGFFLFSVLGMPRA